MNIENLLKQIVGEGASDLFVIAGLPLACKVGGRQKRFDTPRLMPDDTEDCIRQIYRLSGRDEALMDKAGNHDDDFSFAISGLGRFRVNVFRQRGSISDRHAYEALCQTRRPNNPCISARSGRLRASTVTGSSARNLRPSL